MSLQARLDWEAFPRFSKGWVRTIGVTRFPNGISVGSEAGGTAEFQIGGTAINPFNYLGSGVATKFAAGSAVVTAGSVNVATGLATVSYAQVTALGPLSSTAGTAGGFVVPTVAPIGSSGGSICIRGYDQMGTASSTTGTAYWYAIGS